MTPTPTSSIFYCYPHCPSGPPIKILTVHQYSYKRLKSKEFKSTNGTAVKVNPAISNTQRKKNWFDIARVRYIWTFVNLTRSRGREGGRWGAHRPRWSHSQLPFRNLLSMPEPCDKILAKLINQGYCCCSFLIETNEKNFPYMEIAEIYIEINLIWRRFWT